MYPVQLAVHAQLKRNPLHMKKIHPEDLLISQSDQIGVSLEESPA